MAAKDWTLKATVEAERALGTWARTVSARMRGRERDAGAGFVEYAGLMILIAGIFTLIDQLGLDGLISGAIGDAVNDVIGGG
ncbi:hypothetical protein [Streptomyces minutiscleroticus]|uniref:Uncharacterized protein n=1 Tax=Streptomyces minutiscleroticus TaxID=68238 RepID=A0A918KCU6_9ACTN|nr:hypothetical protein [Streptomyces minutiscleroticus]GGX57471.1 hypothetical protein GCM10010358_09500 [Streptomyces minutiscleroticus]